MERSRLKLATVKPEAIVFHRRVIAVTFRHGEVEITLGMYLSMQRGCVLRVIAAYTRVSVKTTLVVAGLIPFILHAEERVRLHRVSKVCYKHNKNLSISIYLSRCLIGALNLK